MSLQYLCPTVAHTKLHWPKLHRCSIALKMKVNRCKQTRLSNYFEISLANGPIFDLSMVNVDLLLLLMPNCIVLSCIDILVVGILYNYIL